MKRPQMIAVALIAPILLTVGCGKTITCGFDPCRIAIGFSPTAPINLEQGNTATLSVTVTSDNKYAGTADLDVGASDLPNGVTASFAPKQVNLASGGPNSSILTLTATSSAPLVTAKDVTINAVGQGTASSTKFKLNLTPPPTKTVNGKVFKFNGDAANGVQVQLEDATGVKTPSGGVTTGTDGGFQVSGVTPPYSVSAWVPGLSAIPFRPVTWTGVKRLDPQIVFPSPPLSVPVSSWTTTCTRADATITGTLTPAVAAKSTGYLIYIAPGVTFRGYAFDDPNYAYAFSSVAAGSSTYSLAVPFDTGLCKTQTTGGLIYVEQEDLTGNYTRATLINPVSVSTGNPTPINISSAAANLVTLTTTLNAPTGTPKASYYPTFRVNGLTSHCCKDYAYPPTQIVNAGGTATFKVPALPGLEYRIHVHGNPFIDQVQTGSYWSTNVSSSANIAIDLLNLIGPIGPNGALSGSTPFTPTFSYNPVTNAALYQVHIKNANGDTIWTGYTNTTSVKLPNLPPPAQLGSGKTYTWAVDAISLRNTPSIDDLLDGRMKLKNWDFANSHYYADEMIGASYNYQGTTFNTP